MIFFETVTPLVLGIVVVCGGLNVQADAMGSGTQENTIVKTFLDNGFDVMLAVLSGQTKDAGAMKSVTADVWINEASMAYNKASEIAAKKNVPLYFAGFSLGALVFPVNMINMIDDAAQEKMFSKMILFAPAIATKNIACAIKIAGIFAKDDKIIKSKSPIAYRANDGTSIGAYKALFELKKQFKKKPPLNIDTLVFIDKKDEVISNVQLKKIIKKYSLSNWKLVTIHSEPQSDIRPKFYHLIIDANCVGTETWKTITSTISAFLNES
ncbi:MAG: hypothetical protein Ta2F_03190 [Termitinemataceae bacterium]|nr:MAG: hypothetical protein Ta2F_03190 [Termitinemataceae bacterium]